MTSASLTREQLEARLATLHRVSLELVREISLEALLERIARLACEEVNARYAAVGVLGKEDQLDKFITVGLNADEVGRMGHPPVGKGLLGALIHSEQPIRVPDIHADERSAGFPAQHPVMSSFLGVPIRLGERALGQIYLTDKLSGAEFTADDQRVIETLAAYAAVAISNARLYQQLTQRDQMLTQRNENLGLLNELAATLASSSDIDPILEKILAQVTDYLKIEVGEIFLLREDGRVLQLAFHQGSIAEGLWTNQTFHMGEGLVGQAARDGQPTMAHLPPTVDAVIHEMGINPAVVTGKLSQVACFPLSGRGGVLGVLSVAASLPEPLDDLQIQFLSNISAWVGTVIDNARLSLQQRRLAVLEERERIGMDLHDGIIQDIYAVGLTLEHARLLLNENPQAAHRRIEQAINDLNSTIRDIRAYILDLRPRKLHEEDLMDGIRRLAAEFRANTLVEITVQGPNTSKLNLPDASAIALFHICQEALANVAKHAHAKRVEVLLWSSADRVMLEVNDDGRGFDFSRVRLTLGHGLSNMQTRARNVGGEVEITAEPHGGTSILAWVPLLNESNR